MYKVKATVNNMNAKDSSILVYPFFIWMFLFFAILFTMYKTKWYFLLIPLIIEFLSIIPLFILEVKVAKKIRKDSFVVKEIELYCADGCLYTDDIKLEVSYYEELNSVSLLSYNADDKLVYCADLIESEIKGLLEYCQKNEIEITIASE